MMSGMLSEDGRTLLNRGESVRMDSRRGRLCSRSEPHSVCCEGLKQHAECLLLLIIFRSDSIDAMNAAECVLSDTQTASALACSVQGPNLPLATKQLALRPFDLHKAGGTCWTTAHLSHG